MLCEGDEMLIVAYWAALPVGPSRLGPVQPEEGADPIQEANRLRVEVPVQYCQLNSPDGKMAEKAEVAQMWRIA